MKKSLRKFISCLFPKGHLKERLKLVYYQLKSQSNIHFDRQLIHGANVYKTTVDTVSLTTNEALYHVVADFGYYEHFYKVQKGDVVLDAGANCGHLSLYYALQSGPSGKVFAFEPDRFNIQRIQANLQLNPTVNTVCIEELLLWNTNEWIDFYEAGTVGSSAHWKPDNNLLVQKQAVTIDDWVDQQQLKRLDFIKMDIEGAEIEALLGCRKTIEKFQPNFAIASYHYVQNEQTYHQLEAFFKSLEYPFQTITFKPGEIITFAGKGIRYT